MRAKGLACGVAIVMVCILSAGLAGAATENPNVTLFGNNAGSLNAGTFVTFVGDSAGFSNSADDNTFVGDAAGQSNTNGFENTFTGVRPGGQTPKATSTLSWGHLPGVLTLLEPTTHLLETRPEAPASMVKRTLS